MSNKSIQGVACVFYPESCPVSNFYDYIYPFYPVALSPLHCWDKNKDGSLKKPHYHVLFQNTLSAKDKRYISKILCNNEYFENIYDIQSYYHYLYHWDYKANEWCKGKSAYWKIDIVESETFDSSKLETLFKDYFNDMLAYISHFVEFADFVDSLSTIGDEDFIKYLFSQYHFISLYIKSNHFKVDKTNN